MEELVLDYNGKKLHCVPSSELNTVDYVYHKLMIDILSDGVWKDNRTGTKALSLFGPQIIFENINEHFPLITTKKIHLKSVIGELLWFLSGNTNKFVLKEKYDCTIWDEWGDNSTGELGPIYGKQWVNWSYMKPKFDTFDMYHHEIFHAPGGTPCMTFHINQIQNVIDGLKTNPDSRRLIVSAWNVGELDQMALAPCHRSFQFYSWKNPIHIKRYLDILVDIRSNDIFLGAPFNIASYAMLLMMIAKEVDMIPNKLIINIGDAHLYENHIPYVLEQLKRGSAGNSPQIVINPLKKNVFSYEPDDFHLLYYNAHANWRNIPIAV
jgi:thymidylate synthase